MAQDSVFLCRGEGKGKCMRFPLDRMPEVLRHALALSRQEAVEVWTGYGAPRRLVTSLGPESQFGRRRRRH
jgi:hypothetical protein